MRIGRINYCDDYVTQYGEWKNGKWVIADKPFHYALHPAGKLIKIIHLKEEMPDPFEGMTAKEKIDKACELFFGEPAPSKESEG